MILNGHYAPCFKIHVFFGAHHKNIDWLTSGGKRLVLSVSKKLLIEPADLGCMD